MEKKIAQVPHEKTDFHDYKEKVQALEVREEQLKVKEIQILNKMKDYQDKQEIQQIKEETSKSKLNSPKHDNELNLELMTEDHDHLDKVKRMLQLQKTNCQSILDVLQLHSNEFNSLQSKFLTVSDNNIKEKKFNRFTELSQEKFEDLLSDKRVHKLTKIILDLNASVLKIILMSLCRLFGTQTYVL